MEAEDSHEEERNLEKLGLLVDLKLSIPWQVYIYCLRATGLLNLLTSSETITNNHLLRLKEIKEKVDKGMD